MTVIDKQKYRVLCTQEPSIPIFSQAWWLDSVAGDAWDVVLVENEGKILASLPYVLKEKYSFTVISQPVLTQNLGPWLRPSKKKYADRLEEEKELLQSLFNSLPKNDIYIQNWDFRQTNWLPLYWCDYEQTTKYTYRIEDLKNIDEIWDSFQKNSKLNINKATNRYGLSVRTDLSLNDFLKLNEMVFNRQGLKVPYSNELVHRIDAAATARNCRKIFTAVDSTGRQHGALYLIWDDNSAYALMGGSDPDLRKSGAISLCRWEAIKFAATVTNSFDFEGSMIEQVERSYRAFGAKQIPYFQIKKINSRILRFGLAFKQILKSR